MNDNSPTITEETQNTSLATASLISSILGIVPLLGFIFGTAGLIFGVMALRRHYQNPDKYGGEIRAIFGLLIWAVLMAAWTFAAIYAPETLTGSA